MLVTSFGMLVKIHEVRFESDLSTYLLFSEKKIRLEITFTDFRQDMRDKNLRRKNKQTKINVFYSLFHQTAVTSTSSDIIRELKQLRRRRQLFTCLTRFSTFWRPLHDYDVKPPNLTFYGGRGHTTTNFPSSSWTWIKSSRIQLYLTYWAGPN